MKKHLIAAALLALSAPVFAGTLEVGATSATVGGGFAPANSQSLKLATGLGSSTDVELEAARAHQWGTTAMLYEGAVTHHFGDNISLKVNAGGSDTGVIAPKQKVGALVMVGVPAVTGLSVGAGYEHVGMRGTALKTDTLVSQAEYTVPGMPLKVTGNANMQRVDSNHNGMVYKVALDYGTPGRWTAGAMAQTGVSSYGDVVFPGAVVGTYRDTSVALNAKYWVSRDFGVMAQASRDKNKFFTQNEVGVGMFKTW